MSYNIIDKLKQLNLLSDTGQITNTRLKHNLTKHHPETWEDIVNLTSFLSPSCSIRERLFCLQHNILSAPQCQSCNQLVTFVCRGLNSYYSTFCSTSCSSSNSDVKQKSINANLLKYGVLHHSQIPATQAKRKQTNIEKYGVGSPAQCSEIMEKIKQTNKVRYGVEWVTQSPIRNNKANATLLKKYGVGNAMQHPDIKQKANNTILEKWGVSSPMQHPDIKEKVKTTNLKKYGTTCSIASRQQELAKVRAEQNMKKYGVRHTTQIHMKEVLRLISDKEWLIDQYITQGKTAESIARDLNINAQTVLNYLHTNEISIRYSYSYSYRAIDWLTTIAKQTNVHIQHALNGGEYLIPGTKFKVDGFCAETNTVYEFYGDLFHGNPKVFERTEQCHPFTSVTAGELHDKTIEREKQIVSLGYIVITMWENDYINQQNAVDFVE